MPARGRRRYCGRLALLNFSAPSCLVPASVVAPFFIDACVSTRANFQTHFDLTEGGSFRQVSVLDNGESKIIKNPANCGVFE